MFGCAVGTSSNARLGAGLDVVYCGNLEAPISSFTIDVVFGRSFGTTQKSHLYLNEPFAGPNRHLNIQKKEHRLKRNMTNEGEKKG